MVNVYVLRNDGTTPAGWTDASSTYAEKLIKLSGTPLSTGGALSHTHNLTDFSCSSSSSGSQYSVATGSGFPYDDYVHSHTQGTTDVQAASNFPSYKDYRLVYRSVTGWNGKVPAGSIVFRENVPTDWTRVDSGQSYFIRITATAGGTGGNDAHTHSTGIALANWCGNDARTDLAGTPVSSRCRNCHGHDIKYENSSSQSYDYKYWGAGLISADSEQQVKADSYLLFDDTPPSSQWQVVSADGRYLKAVGTNAPETGGTNTTFTHGHSVSMTSNGPNNVADIRNGARWAPTGNHTHTVTANLADETAEPAYVSLILAKAIADISSGGTPRAIFVTTC